MFDVGTIIGGRFRIDQVLGAGGMGVVASATHVDLGHRVAIKVMRPELAADQTMLDRFMREARAVSMLRTEHVCRVMDVGIDHGAPYIVMELLEGTDLAHLIKREPLPVHIAVDYVLQACSALAEAHAAGIVHRDLKPANLMVTRRADGTSLVKVLDFGIAKARDVGPQLTHASGMMGSPGYTPPEQIQSARDVDARADIWALGVTLYQLLSARMPFTGPSLAEIAIKIAMDPPEPIDVDPALRAVIGRCLEKQPERRFATVGELAAALAPFRATRSAPVAAPSPRVAINKDAATAPGSIVAPAPTAPAPRRRWPFVVLPIALLGVLGVVAVLASGSEPPAARTIDAGAIAATPIDAAPIDAALPIDAATLDPWRDIDAGIEPEPEPEPEPDVASKNTSSSNPTIPADPNDLFAQMRASCREVISQADQFSEVPMMLPQLAICYCALDMQAKANATIAKIADSKMRTGVQQGCRDLARVKKQTKN